MYETVWFGLWLLAVSFSALQLFFHRGGVIGTFATMIAWITLYFSSTNVTAAESAGLITTNNPLAMWLAAFMAFAHFLVLLFVLVGIGPWSDSSGEEDGLADVAGGMGGRL
jgi:hypothetical protein